MDSIYDFGKAKQKNRKISMVTCYDFWSAKIIDASQIDCVLVGDSLAMVMHGFESTLHATTEMMALHASAVCRGTSKFVVVDMPFLSYRKGVAQAIDHVQTLMHSGAKAIKLEGVTGHEDVIQHIVHSGVPVMGHIGLTPQSIHQIGGFRVQGKNEESAKILLQEAQTLEELGCFAIVLECVPSHVADEITKKLQIPTIGIGAGIETDGQVLVLQDLLGMDDQFRPKFLKHYLAGKTHLSSALNQFDTEVKERIFPSKKESYS
ncbi:3-methyl-2-oxobutanoate hydroxymethyltransferase [Candidatus Uabimicrobium amorphum]|uniref:3-methyl-2-oxobutanoate hydroxymethyltransferase n=1 Tax=Uabimicrobium amorphum TaxID=2596890 RepID=A0A5S9IIY6_UABAM|nr:3-methyl-2-oxobutanoate hydroxymethyltransferase [Candidatus Uabimicrobium amorphum]BBM82708.1 3-methyl-2-oxobutanoatehydroxymethyltransferase [Candidatus Uabimicrobium amorphum]